MTLKQLRLFLAIADHRSVSRGAEVMQLVQSTASQHLRSLEEEFGATLFDRGRDGVVLTGAGELLAEHARRICIGCDEAAAALKRFAGAEEGVLKVGASTVPAACQVPDALGAFNAVCPGVRIELTQGDSREILQRLLGGELELAVVGGQFALEGVVYLELQGECIELIARPAAGLPAELDPAKLAGLPLVIREPGSGTRMAVDLALRQAGIDPGHLRVVAQLGSSEAVRRALLGGAGCAFLSRLTVGRELAEGSLVTIPVRGIAIRRSFYLAWRKGRTLSPAANAFRSVLAGSARQVVCASLNPSA